MQNTKPIIGITLGDINGIGPEVVIKALSHSPLVQKFTPVIYGATKVMAYYRKAYNWAIDYFEAPSIRAIHAEKINIISENFDQKITITPGKPTFSAAQHALQALQQGVAALQNKQIAAMVTAPIHKQSMQAHKFEFPGHTEFFQHHFSAKDAIILMVADDLRVGLATGHIPLRMIGQWLTKTRLLNKIDLLHQSLQHDFGIAKPKIAVLGLNPHAGEAGVLGQEEQNIIVPMINVCKEKGMHISGPYAADGFFGHQQHQQFDGVLAMYHDQGLIPFKTLAYGGGVNFTAGLPIVRTSPAHGTAFGLAGKNQAKAQSMCAAMTLALTIVRKRNTLP